MYPSTGRVVHFQRVKGALCRAAVVTQVWDEAYVNLYVLPDGVNEVGGVETWVLVAGDGRPGANRWHWPEQVR